MRTCARCNAPIVLKHKNSAPKYCDMHPYGKLLHEAVALMSEGRTNREIAEALRITQRQAEYWASDALRMGILRRGERMEAILLRAGTSSTLWSGRRKRTA